MFPSNSHFMIVDDSEAIRTLLAQQLHQLGIKSVLEAEDGKDALSKIEKHYKKGSTISLAIIDWKMPKMNGLKLLLALRDDDRYKDIPVLMIAAEHDLKNVAQALAEGADNFILKPFDEAMLLEKISAIWKRLQPKK